MTVYRRGARGIFHYDFRVGGQRYAGSTHVTIEEKARNVESVVRADALRGRLEQKFGIRRSRRVPTFREFIEKTIYPELDNNLTRQGAGVGKSILRKFIAAWGGQRLTAVTPEMWEAFKAERLQHVSINMVRQEFRWLRRLYNAAVRHQHLLASPLPRNFPMPKATRQPDRVLTPAEEATLLAAVDRPVIRAMLRLTILVGLRRAEACRLRWGQVDLEGRRIAFTAKGQTIRRLPLVPEAVELLLSIRTAVVALERPVFINRAGRAFAPSSFYCAYTRARAAAGLRDVRLHDLRHTTATRLAQAGFDLATVGEVLGHRPPYHETLRYFAHTSEVRVRQALETLQMGSAPASQEQELRETKRALQAALRELAELRQRVAMSQQKPHRRLRGVK